MISQQAMTRSSAVIPPPPLTAPTHLLSVSYTEPFLHDVFGLTCYSTGLCFILYSYTAGHLVALGPHTSTFDTSTHIDWTTQLPCYYLILHLVSHSPRLLCSFLGSGVCFSTSLLARSSDTLPICFLCLTLCTISLSLTLPSSRYPPTFHRLTSSYLASTPILRSYRPNYLIHATPQCQR
jgi:hypothetical protein